MSDSNIETDDTFASPPPPSVGTQLRLAREARGLSAEEAGQALKLAPRQMEALENDEWNALPGITFVRGFVRNYARLVQLDVDALMAQLDNEVDVKRPELAIKENASAPMPEPVGRSRRRDYAVAFIGLALVVVAVLIYFFLPSDLSQVRNDLQSIVAGFSKPAAEPPAPPAPATPQNEPVLPPGATVNEVLNPHSAPPGESPAAPAPPPGTEGSAPAGNAAPQAAPAPGAPGAQTPQAEQPPATGAPLRLTFVQESWVEVRDRRGNVILSLRGMPGMEKEVDGQGPFMVVIGFAPGVTLKYRGQNVDFAPFTSGNVARFTLE